MALGVDRRGAGPRRRRLRQHARTGARTDDRTAVGQPDRLLGLTPLRDQQLAGLVMIVEQLLTLGTLAAVVLVPELRARRAVPPRLAAGQTA